MQRTDLIPNTNHENEELSDTLSEDEGLSDTISYDNASDNDQALNKRKYDELQDDEYVEDEAISRNPRKKQKFESSKNSRDQSQTESKKSLKKTKKTPQGKPDRIIIPDEYAQTEEDKTDFLRGRQSGYHAGMLGRETSHSQSTAYNAGFEVGYDKGIKNTPKEKQDFNNGKRMGSFDRARGAEEKTKEKLIEMKVSPEFIEGYHLQYNSYKSKTKRKHVEIVPESSVSTGHESTMSTTTATTTTTVTATATTTTERSLNTAPSNHSFLLSNNASVTRPGMFGVWSSRLRPQPRATRTENTVSTRQLATNRSK